MDRPKLTAQRMEVAIAQLINFRSHVMVPNVSWGLGLRHECDILVLDSKGRFTEVEIKISKSDLLKDLEKKHGHRSEFISRLIYAVPHELIGVVECNMAQGVGIISVKWSDRLGRYYAEHHRVAKHGIGKKPTQEIKMKFMELGCMRIWSLKSHLIKSK